MKHQLLLILLLLACPILYAQVIDRPTLASGGEAYVVNGTVSIQSTLGETLIQTIKLGSTTFTQGFQQPDFLINLPVQRGAGTLSDLLVYPNPAVDLINIQFNMADPAMVKASLYNKSGKLVESMLQYCAAGLTQLPFSFHVSSGLYVLELSYKGYTITTKVLVL